jgi:hypothetical protein
MTPGEVCKVGWLPFMDNAHSPGDYFFSNPVESLC